MLRSLAHCELYFTFAYLFRRFDVGEDPTKPSYRCLMTDQRDSTLVILACDRPADLTWSEHFLPLFERQHLRAYCDPTV